MSTLRALSPEPREGDIQGGCVAVGEVLEWAFMSRSWEMVVEGEGAMVTLGERCLTLYVLEGRVETPILEGWSRTNNQPDAYAYHM